MSLVRCSPAPRNPRQPDRPAALGRAVSLRVAGKPGNRGRGSIGRVRFGGQGCELLSCLGYRGMIKRVIHEGTRREKELSTKGHEGPLRGWRRLKRDPPKVGKGSLLQNSSGSGIYCREELLSLGARASRPHKTWQGRGDWLHRVGRFTRRLTLEQRLDKYAGGTPALPGGNPWLARCRSLSRALFCRSILPPSHARLRILQKAQGKKISTKGVKVSVKGVTD